MALASEFLSGSIFGGALFASGVYAPEVITGQMELASFHMAKTMLAASATSALIIHGADRAGFAKARVRPPSNLGFCPFDGNILGGALIGLGMAMSGACPGTSLVQLAVGIPTGRTVVVGGVLGAIVYPFVLSKIQAATSRRQPTSSHAQSFSESFGVTTGSVLVGWELMCLSLLWLTASLPNTTPTQKNKASFVDPVSGGLLVGFAQAATVGLTRHALGVSGAYADCSRWLGGLVKSKKGDASKRHFFTPSVVFAAGIMASSAVLAAALLARSPAVQSAAAPADQKLLLPFLGGISLVLGARFAGGCTSGHGISGLATGAWSSMITTSVMMLGGIGFSLLGGLLSETISK